MKKLTALLLALALALCLCGCTRGRGASTGSDLTQAEIDHIVEEMERAEAEGK